jgi:glycerophosphoryl diester phosphodiesterase
MRKIYFILLAVLAFHLNSCSQDKTTQVIAHRGGAKLAPENTSAAFQHAINLGVDMIEIDVEQTSDSVVVVLHDDHVDRTTNGTGRIDSLSYAYVKKLDAGSWFADEYKDERISTLEEVLQLINGQVILLIEIKDGSERYPGIEKRTVDLVHKYKANSWVIIQSFNKKAIDRVKILDTSLRTYYLLGGGFNNFYKEAKATSSFDFDHEGVGVHQKYLNEENINNLMESGIKIFAWTVNNPADMDKFLQFGIDGIITDSPDILIKKMATNPAGK